MVLALCPSLAQAQRDWRYADVPRIVAFGDVHGAYSELADLLRSTGIVDGDLRWVGGNTHLVSLGDLLDRGAESRKVMDLLMRLQGEATRDGGRVHVVLGNHEVMNLIGDLRYVSAGEFLAFANDEPADARQAAYERFVAEQNTESANSERANTENAVTEIELDREFERRYPPGYFGHRAAFAADGIYGAWLLSLPALVVINDTVFAHGGLSELIASAGTGINERINATLTRYLELREALVEADILPRFDMEDDRELTSGALTTIPADNVELVAMLEEFMMLADAPELGTDGPLWYRGAVYCSALLERPGLEAALERLDVANNVVGHTPTVDGNVRALYDGKVVMLDTGMLKEYYGGRPAALVIEGGDRHVQYVAPLERAAIDRERPLAYRLTEAELLAALADGEITLVDELQPNHVRLDANGVSIDATFYRARNDSAQNEMAAFVLDRLLGLNLVPPTVTREIDGISGALQLRFPEGISETERIERRLASAWCPLEPQFELLYVFDLLTGNLGRIGEDIFYRNDASNLVLVNHTQAFTTRRQLPNLPEGLELVIPGPLFAALMPLDEAMLDAALGEWLDRRQIRALLARRDALLNDFPVE